MAGTGGRHPGIVDQHVDPPESIINLFDQGIAIGPAPGVHPHGQRPAAQPDLLMPPESVADAYWALYNQPKSAWTFEQEIRPYGEKW